MASAQTGKALACLPVWEARAFGERAPQQTPTSSEMGPQ